MNQEAETLVRIDVLLPGNLCVALKTELCDSVGDGIVQTPIQGAELPDGEWRISLKCQISDCLADVAVVVNDLVD